MNAAVEELCADSGVLLRVLGNAAASGSYRSLHFEFGAGVLSLRCDNDIDEIIATVDRGDPAATPVTETWAQKLLGKDIQYGWELRNHRGYLDGFQLRLMNMNDKHEEEAVQFEVAASTLLPQSVVAF